MEMNKVIAAESVKTKLEAMLSGSRVPHALLLYENDGQGGVALSMALFCRLLGKTPSEALQAEKLIHPDLVFVFPTAHSKDSTCSLYLPKFRAALTKNPYSTSESIFSEIGTETKSVSISVSDANELLVSLSQTPLCGGNRVVFFYLPEKMNQAVANKLLKLIEEPPANTYFILLTHSPEKIIQTIFSRCSTLRVPPFTKEEAARAKAFSESTDEQTSELFRSSFESLIKAVIEGDLLQCVDFAESMDALKNRNTQKDFCTYSCSALRDIFLHQQKMSSLSEGINDNFSAWAATRLARPFVRMSMGVFDEAYRLIDRNVGAKMVFCDLADSLYILQNGKQR
ncbi:MAG: hypothetical protein HUJ95_00775 [Bacteroidales bacterium]|nr:hypothetical protein [Bacteroidales bacterium]